MNFPLRIGFAVAHRFLGCYVRFLFVCLFFEVSGIELEG